MIGLRSGSFSANIAREMAVRNKGAQNATNANQDVRCGDGVGRNPYCGCTSIIATDRSFGLHRARAGGCVQQRRLGCVRVLLCRRCGTLRSWT
ncbi:hypothetical protein NOVOSPHI9U_590003 [Novosphingobium sp. 9U]|nr:hypothetical protein NOVOSPHI9U_590003 [Novosphingobium sp. 9U]